MAKTTKMARTGKPETQVRPMERYEIEHNPLAAEHAQWEIWSQRRRMTASATFSGAMLKLAGLNAQQGMR